jgi:hypothetical protein
MKPVSPADKLRAEKAELFRIAFDAINNHYSQHGMFVYGGAEQVIKDIIEAGYVIEKRLSE